MKKLILTILAVVALGAATAAAQQPRVRTSAPAEQTAQKGVKTKAGDAAKAPAAKAGSAIRAKRTAATRPYMALKTNVAYDVFAVMNLAYECQFAPRFTAELPVMWSLWDWKADRGLRIVALQPGVKYWFSAPGQGHAVGADFDLAWYNYRWDRNRYQNTGRPLMGVSLNYAYTLQLGRGWKAEFSLGVGYINTRYNTYFNIDNGALLSTRDRNYFGPTRIGISLAYEL